MEIERKFLVPNLPDLSSFKTRTVEQGYLCTDPVVRVRRDNDDYYLTYKSEGFKCREEYNLPLTRESYEHLITKIDGRLITKTRYMIPLTDTACEAAPDGLTCELDVFSGDLYPLTLAEVEFPDVETADSFTPPAWFGEDVTDSGKYQNSYLSSCNRCDINL